LKTIKILILIYILLLFSFGSASAIIFGTKYSNNTPAITIAEGSQDNEGRFGIFLGTEEKNHSILLGIGYNRHKFQSDASYYTRRLTLSLEYRYQLIATDQAQAMKILPFATIAYFRSFSQVTADSLAYSPAEVSYYKDLSNDKGGWIAIGAEYFLAPVFTIGCEGGLRYVSAKTGALGYEVKITEFKTYVAFLMTFRI